MSYYQVMLNIFSKKRRFEIVMEMTEQQASEIVKEFDQNVGKLFLNRNNEKHLFYNILSIGFEYDTFHVKITMINKIGHTIWRGTPEAFLVEYGVSKKFQCPSFLISQINNF